VPFFSARKKQPVRVPPSFQVRANLAHQDRVVQKERALAAAFSQDGKVLVVTDEVQ
jgi:hypothetical protein